MKNTTRIDEVIQRLTPEEYVRLFCKEPITETIKTRNGYCFKMVVISKTATRQVQAYLQQLSAFGDVEFSEGNFASIVNVYGIDRFDLPNLKNLVNQIKKGIRMN